MPNILTTHMHRVLDAGVALKERLEKGERPNLATEQASLKMLLMGDNELRVMPDYIGEGNYGQSIMGQAKGGAPTYRGVKYGLTCWLDEMFINDGPREWSDAWNEQKLESSLYQSNDRRWMFWEQARLAELRPGTDVLEAYYWCVMLGFRGEHREEPQKLDNWARAARARLVGGQQQDWPLPPEREVPSNVPLRGAKDRFQTMMMAWQVAMLVAVPLVSFILIRIWGK
jgi:type VI protein secretion system component VasF